MTDMIGPFNHRHEAHQALADTQAAHCKGRWYVYASSNGYWLRWAAPGPHNPPVRQAAIDQEVLAYVTRKDARGKP